MTRKGSFHQCNLPKIPQECIQFENKTVQMWNLILIHFIYPTTITKPFIDIF